MEKVTTAKRLLIVRYYLSGLSYDEIAIKTGISKGTVANVISDLKLGKFPEAADVREHIELFRELSLELKRSGLTPGQCTVGLTVLKRINECGLNPADMDRWPLILKEAEDEEQAQVFIKLIYRIQEVQKRTGLGLEDLDNKVHDLEKKAADLEPVAKQLDERKKQLAELTKQRDNLTSSVASLEEKYKFLNPRVKDLEKREHDLSQRVKDMDTGARKAEAAITNFKKETQKLFEIGFSLEALAEFSQKIQSIAKRYSIVPEDIRDRLLKELESLDQAVGLESLMRSRQAELEKQEKAVTTARQDAESLKAVVASLKQEKANLEASIKESSEKVLREIAKIIPVARDTVNQAVGKLRQGHDEILEEVRRLAAEAIEVGKEVGRSQEMLQGNDWLNGLLALVRGEESLEGKRVKAIVLLVLRGAAAWLKHDEANTLRLSTLPYTLESLIKELEKWKV